MRKIIFVAVIVCIALNSYAVDSLRIDQKSFDRSRLDRMFNRGVWANSALYFFSGDYSFSEINGKGSYENGGLLLQQGDLLKSISIHTNSFVELDKKTRIWGRAWYENSRREGVKYNNTSDFLLLYPYVTADSVGGAMKGETYAFNGGYARQLGRYTLAAELSYRATIEYRNVDPRPKNVVSDLTAKIALARELFGYRVALSLNAGKYKQTNSVKFVSELKNVPIYHLTGLGSDYARFRGTFLNSFYDGGSYGGSIDVMPIEGEGLSFSLARHSFSYDKLLSDLNDISINKLLTVNNKLEISYLKRQKGVKVELQYDIRNGIENIYGSPTGQFYPLIASADNYSNKRFVGQITGLYGKNISSHTLILSPRVNYSNVVINYYEGQKYMKSSTVGLGASIDWSVSFRKSTLTAMLGVYYNANLNSEIDVESGRFDVLTDNYAVLLTSDNLKTSAKIRYDLSVAKLGGGVFCELRYFNEHHFKYKSIGTTIFSVGFTL